MFAKSERDAQFRELNFESGVWSLRIPQGSFFIVRKLVADGREASLPKSRPVTPGAEPIEVRGQWLKRGRLRVIDAATKQDLHDVEVRSAQGRGPNPDWTHPGDSTEIASVIHSAASPFDLPDSMTVTSYWVHVAGHAWARVDFDHRVGGEQVVELAEPASISVSIAGGSLPGGAFVRLYPRQKVSFGFEARVSVNAATSGPTRIDDVAPGHYFACVEVGEFDSRQRLGEAPVELVAREVANVTVTIDAGKLDVPTVHLFGTLALPAGADEQHAALSLWREGGEAQPISIQWSAMAVQDRDEHTRAWDAGTVRAGTWGASVRPGLYRQLIRADGPGEVQADIRVPEIVTVSVDVTDAATGVALEPERLMWSDSQIEGLSQGFNCPLQPAGAKGAYKFEAPIGVVNVSCTLNGYSPCYEVLDLNGSVRTLRIKLVRACGVHVEVFEGEARLRVGFAFFNGVECYAPDQLTPCGSPAGGTEFDCTRQFDAPGTYVLKFPALEGYEPIEPMTVDVPAGRIAEVPVRVKRKP